MLSISWWLFIMSSLLSFMTFIIFNTFFMPLPIVAVRYFMLHYLYSYFWSLCGTLLLFFSTHSLPPFIILLYISRNLSFLYCTPFSIRSLYSSFAYYTFSLMYLIEYGPSSILTSSALLFSVTIQVYFLIANFCFAF